MTALKLYNIICIAHYLYSTLAINLGRNKYMERKTAAELEKMYDYVSLFFEEMAQVRKGNEWFHIREDGTPVYEERYDYVSPFSRGLAWAWKGTEKFQIRYDGTRAQV